MFEQARRLDVETTVSPEKRSDRAEERVFFEGIKQLSVFLDTIKDKSGNLPGALIFPETSARPLYWLIEPVIRQTYKKEGKQMPDCFFMKTIRADLKDPEYDEKLNKDNVSDVLEEKHELYKKKDNLLRLLKNTKNRKQRERMRKSVERQIADTKKEIEYLEEKIAELKIERKQIESFDPAAVQRTRMEQILSYAKPGDVLVVDDLVSNGTTLKAIHSALETTEPDRKMWGFAFVNTCGEDKLDFLDNRFQAGVDNFPDDVLATREGSGYSDFDAWDDLFYWGFRYRVTTDVGVYKSTYDKNPLTEKTDDSRQQRELKEEFHKMGKKALQKIRENVN